MGSKQDVESGSNAKYGAYDDALLEPERESLLPSGSGSPAPTTASTPRYSLVHLVCAFVGGVALCIGARFLFDVSGITGPPPRGDDVRVQAPPYVGSTEVHQFPPASPTNAFPDLFPTNPPLSQPQPALPLQTGAAQLVAPPKIHKHLHSTHGDDMEEEETESRKHYKADRPFNLFRSWGNLSPWYSVPRGAFGVDGTAEPPPGCVVTGLHLLHRHGARYPTAWANYGGPAKFATRLHQSASQTYKLGEEGMSSINDLGVSMRLKYGFLLKSQDRMLASALNFAIGFFGYPFEGQYQQLITIEANGFNNTFAPYKTCPNANTASKANRSLPYVREWVSHYLAEARKRLSSAMIGKDGVQGEFEWTGEEVYEMMQMCAYETVALGYSKFCDLFTEEEWEGFNYAYDSAFGSPVARVQGVGYVQELVARLTQTPIATHNTSTNATLHTPETFPLDHALYVDATHEVVVLNVITALNLSTLAANGPLPADHIPPNRSFRSADLAPFATNMQFQLLSCASTPTPQIRVIINDGVAPLHGIRTCPYDDKYGMCPLPAFIEAQQETIRGTDWTWACHGDWQVPPGSEWNSTTGDAPPA
ncbi:histidine phosphatase superfamily [Suillus ampliporus]|nr:histidine phosphatase superfamily [Suillus ampliporus]